MVHKALLLALPLLLLPTSPTGGTGAITVHGDVTATHLAVVDAVIERYAEAGLALPAVTVVFSGDPRDCGGHIGQHKGTGRGSSVRICESPIDHPVQFRHAVAHELAHAWTATHLTGDDRRRFLEHRSLDSWSGTDVEWRQRGMEHAAEIITWAVLEHPILLVRIPDKSCTRLWAGYIELTARPPAPDPRTCTIS